MIIIGAAFLVPMIASELGYAFNPLGLVLVPMYMTVKYLVLVAHWLVVVAEATSDTAFIVDLEGFEGPLDLLLDLARAHKVDLAQISILELAEQFLAYLRNLQARELQIAAEYLVMAAWLAYLKSQLLLPPAERELDDAEAVAEDLGERLRRLEALRQAAASLQARPRLGSERFARGAPERHAIVVQAALDGQLGRAVGRLWQRDAARAHGADDYAGAPPDDAGAGRSAVGTAPHRSRLARSRELPARRSG